MSDNNKGPGRDPDNKPGFDFNKNNKFALFFLVSLIVMFFVSMNKDKRDLIENPLDKKFSILIRMINEAAFDGKGDVTILSQRELNIYKNGANQIIQFLYSTGNLTIVWKYKYFQKEVVHERTFGKVRNLSVFEQKAIGESLLTEMDTIIEEHKRKVLSGF